jgi:glycosyltransferase involved in cell wall biosynthesis
MILNFVYASTRHPTGGVTMLYEFANTMVRRGHEVHFVHGPALAERITDVDEMRFEFDPAVQHHIVDSLDDPALKCGDVVFSAGLPHLGAPVVFIQGFRLTPRMDAASFRARAPKICTATWLVEVGRSYGVPEAQLVHVPYGLDRELFSATRPQRDRTIDVAMLYHPFREKGWDVGRDVLAALARRRPDLRAVVFTLAEPPGEPLPERVHLIEGPPTQRQLVDEIYSETRVFLQSSHHEGFGLTAVEAMACGAALVTTDCGGSRDYALPDETALVARAGDVSALTDHVDRLLRDTDERQALASAGQRYVQKFDWHRSGELLEAFLEKYLADPAHFQEPPGPDRSSEYAL